MLHAIDRDHKLIEVALAVRPWPVTADARSKVRTKSADPVADCASADHHATFRKQILNIRRTRRKPMVCPDRVSNDFTRVAKALQVRHRRRCFHASPRRQVTRIKQLDGVDGSTHRHRNVPKCWIEQPHVWKFGFGMITHPGIPI